MMHLALALLCALPPQEGAPDTRRLTSAPDRRVELDFQHFYKTRELKLALSSLAAAYPEFVQLSSLGKSRGNEDVWLLSLSETGGVDPRSKPALFISASQCLSDVQGSELALSSIVEFLQNHERDPRVGRALRETTMYFVPCVNPDLRTSVFSMLEQGSLALPNATARVDLERNYPVGWSPFQGGAEDPPRNPGPYPLSEPESRMVGSFLLEHENIGLVVGFAPTDRVGGVETVSEISARERQALQSLLDAPLQAGGATLGFFARVAEPRGSLDDFAYGQLGALPLRLLCGETDVQSGVALPHIDEIAPMAHRVSVSLLALSEALPRVSIAGTSVQRLKNDLWQIEITLATTGNLRTQSELGSTRRSVACPQISIAGGKLAAAGVRGAKDEAFLPAKIDAGRFSLTELEAGVSYRARVLIAAPAETQLELIVSAPRAGRASASLVLR